jgi:superfamily II DNA or RNA helicase
MKKALELIPEINLYGDGIRIKKLDAIRQEKTSQEILKRINSQPGLILADEVGMGKTFVALAVAASVATIKRREGPVVIMVPNNILGKWEHDFETFRKVCISDSKTQKRLSYATATSPIDFLKLLDDPISSRKSIIFLSHSGMTRRMSDTYVKLAFIRQAVIKKEKKNPVRRAVTKYVGDLVGNRQVGNNDAEIYKLLLSKHPRQWTKVLKEYGKIEEDADEVIPQSILEILPHLDYTEIYQALSDLPYRKSIHYEYYINEVKIKLTKCFKSSWKEALKQIKIKLPLLIFDEAHHLKNDNQGNLSLFGTKQSKEYADDAEKGALSGVFGRMLFLTATPFQLGHHELCGILRRFNGIRWQTIDVEKEKYIKKIDELNSWLDKSHIETINFQKIWGKLTQEDLYFNSVQYKDSSSWWERLLKVKESDQISEAARDVLTQYRLVSGVLSKAQKLLQPWVIRHTKKTCLPDCGKKRRETWVGQQTHPGGESNDPEGIKVNSESLAPFLLASRASTFSGSKRAIYVEGLCSTYETFKHTRKQRAKAVDADTVILTDESAHEKERLNWYLDSIEHILPDNKFKSSMTHPKVKATVERAFDIWKKGEKVLIFCFYIETGKILRNLISQRIVQYIETEGQKKMKCSKGEVRKNLKLIFNRLEKHEIFAKSLDKKVSELLRNYKSLQEYTEDIQNVVRMFLRSEACLVRFVPLKKVLSAHGKYDGIVNEIFTKEDYSGLSFKQILDNFFNYLELNMGDSDRNTKIFLDAIKQAQVVTRAKTNDEGDKESESIVPNVKRAAGDSSSEVKHKIMTTFNTPFLPDILVASSVMSEGMDLHLNCRYVIHHDLCWNPSNLEQRTGRIDRIGTKAEIARESIQVFYPYIAATQDEKMYKVVMDREQWFKVVMGGKVKIDQTSIEREAARIPFPEKAAESLQFKLNIV